MGGGGTAEGGGTGFGVDAPDPDLGTFEDWTGAVRVAPVPGAIVVDPGLVGDCDGWTGAGVEPGCRSDALEPAADSDAGRVGSVGAPGPGTIIPVPDPLAGCDAELVGAAPGTIMLIPDPAAGCGGGLDAEPGTIVPVPWPAGGAVVDPAADVLVDEVLDEGVEDGAAVLLAVAPLDGDRGVSLARGAVGADCHVNSRHGPQPPGGSTLWA